MADIYIALGGNLGDVLATFGRVLAALPERGIAVRETSRRYRTAALVPPGAPPGPDYWNAVVHAVTALSPHAVLERLLELEARAGRVRRERWEARPLDLDLLLYGELVLREPNLTLPHPRLAVRGFVLLPLADVASRLVVPGLGATVRQLLERLPEGERQALEVR
ncbi:MAG: 2-amino-4-hydroxy-6-hydroxymethyldihydropteridine diphosphokinase [Actinomycetota bacterium]